MPMSCRPPAPVRAIRRSLGQLGKGVQLPSIAPEVADDQPLGAHFQVGEAVDVLGKTIERRRLLPSVGAQRRPAPAGDDKRRRVTFELEVLEVVDVSAKIEMGRVRAKERVPLRDERLAVSGIGIERMVPAHDEERRGARLRQFRLQPLRLRDAFLRSQGELLRRRLLIVAVEREERDQRAVVGKIKAIPFGGQRPARAGLGGGIGELRLALPRRLHVVIMITQQRVARPRKLRGGNVFGSEAALRMEGGVRGQDVCDGRCRHGPPTPPPAK